MNILLFFQNSFYWIYHKVYYILQLFLQNILFIINEIVQNTQYNFDHLPLHLLILSLFLLITIFVYIRLAYPFWSTQPVYHPYDFYYSYYSAPFLIQSGYPIKTRFYNTGNIHTFDYLELDENQKKQIVNLIQSHSIPEESAIYMFHLGNLDACMTGQLYPSLISIYLEEAYIPYPKSPSLEPPLITDQTQIDIIKKPIGCILSRTIELSIFGIQRPVYFLDFIIVDREKGAINPRISRELIHTHEYRQRKKTIENNNIEKTDDSPRISLFKKETGLSEGIIPLVSFISTLCYIQNKPLRKLPPHFLVVKIHRRNIQLLIDFLEISKTRFQCFGIAEKTNLSTLLHTGLLKIFIIQRGAEVYAAYFFRDSRTQYDRNESNETNHSDALLLLCGSIRNTKSAELFYMGFLHSLRTILRETPEFRILLFERISHNEELYVRYIDKNPTIQKNINQKNIQNKNIIDTIYIGENPSAYYLL